MTATYVKLQEAYASEANAIGGWKMIGYVAPGAATAGVTGTTTNFTYTGSVTADGSVAITTGATEAWKAVNNVALNECSGGQWKIDVTNSGTGNSVKYDATTTCAQLTPTFEKIGK